MMVNSLSTKTWRDKYRSAQIEQALKAALVAEKVCIVDNSPLYTISSPYLTAISTTVQALAGTYTPVAITTSTDTLTVADEVVAATHIFDFESTMANFDLFYTATRGITNSMVTAIDKWVLNELCEGGTGTLDTPVGGFMAPANVVTILANIISQCAGYADTMNGYYVIVENSDLVGIIPSEAGSGFSFADSALNNGFVKSMLGVDIYCVRDGTFVDAAATTASGTKTWTNAGHRVGGVKKVTTYASPRGLKFEEKMRTGYTGMEIVGIGYIGFKQWTPTTLLTIDITVK